MNKLKQKQLSSLSADPTDLGGENRSLGALMVAALNVADRASRFKFAIVLVIAAVVFLPNLAATRLWDEDEGFYASTAAEMYSRNEWIVPYFNGELFGHKPPWMYWMMMLGYSIFGVGELGARFFSAIFGILAVVITYLLGRKLFNERVGFIGAIILATSIMFTVVGRSATPDGFLVFFTVAALYLFSRDFFPGSIAEGHARSGTVRFPSLLTMVLFYAVLGLGMLTKGPIAVLFPGCVAGLFLLFALSEPNISPRPLSKSQLNYLWKNWGFLAWANAVWRMSPITGALIIFAVAGPWYLAVGWQTNWEFHREFFGVHHFQRATNSMEGHRGSVLFYPASILVGMYPWTVATIPALFFWIYCLCRSNKPSASEKGMNMPIPPVAETTYSKSCSGETSRSIPHERLAILFVTAWIGVYLVGFSLAATKLPNYILPAYPALALLFAFGFDVWLKKPDSLSTFWHRGVLGVLIFVGASLIAIFPILVLVPFRGQTVLERVGASPDLESQIVWFGWLGLPAVLGGVIAIFLVEQKKFQAAFGVFALVALATVVGIWNVAVPWIDQFQGPQEMVSNIRETTARSDDKLATFDFFRPSMVFYNRASIKKYYSDEQVKHFFANHPSGLLLMDSSRFSELKASLPADVSIVYRRSRFPEKGEIMALARNTELVADNKQ